MFVWPFKANNWQATTRDVFQIQISLSALIRLFHQRQTALVRRPPVAESQVQARGQPQTLCLFGYESKVQIKKGGV